MAADHDPTGAGHAFQDWLGRERVTEDTITLERARKLAATLDLDPGALAEGDPLPAGWHWIYHRGAVRRSGLAEDGHERRGDFLPPIRLDRRMWAGGRLHFARPLRIGASVRRVSTIRSIEEKEGRSGPLALVTVRHRLHDADGVALEEEQDLVYLERRFREEGSGAEEPSVGAPGGRSEAKGAADAPEPHRSDRFRADEVTLFRFSALTFNGHRIHYDRSYATEVERYPDLVVHGPLLALLLLSAGVRWARLGEGRAPGDPVELHFRYRALQPVFCNEEIELCGLVAGGTGASSGGTGARASRTEGSFELWAAHPERGVAMRAGLAVKR